jgi:hypothetical protein
MTNAALADYGPRKLAADGRHAGGYVSVPREVLFDHSLPEGAIALWVLLSSIGLKLIWGVSMAGLARALPASRRSVLRYMDALRDRGLVTWSFRDGRWFLTLAPLEGVHGPLSGSWAHAHHALVHDREIPLRQSRL